MAPTVRAAGMQEQQATPTHMTMEHSLRSKTFDFYQSEEYLVTLVADFVFNKLKHFLFIIDTAITTYT